ncbi:MAG: transcriptional regulator [Patescibacteria group bacterium]|nr:MAG: transcriptional regulator [Patescibacteria group bacterium]
MLSDLITSKSRINLLNVFLSNPYEMFHVRECVRRTGDEINAVRRELQFLEKRGILQKEQRANRLYYFLDKEYPFYYDLLALGVKTIGLGAEVLENKAKLGKIKYAMFSGRFVRRYKKNPDDVDFMVIGTIVLPELAVLIRKEEQRLGIEINYTAMTEEEFKFRKKRNDPFITGILSQVRVMLIGDEEAMLA